MKERIIIGLNIYLKLVLSIDLPNKNEKYFYIYKNETDEYIGNCGIRLDNNLDNYYLGNIEYEIFAQYRGNHYSKEACLLLAEEAYSNNLKSLIVTANVKNKSSIKIIESLGAKLINVTKVPKKCVLYRQGDRVLNIYEWNIQKRKEKKYDRY
jgi:predicted acetyltransferase